MNQASSVVPHQQMTTVGGALGQACFVGTLQHYLPGHSPQALVSLQRWHRTLRSAVHSSKRTRQYISHIKASETAASEVDSVAGAGVIKTQVQSKTLFTVYDHNQLERAVNVT